MLSDSLNLLFEQMENTMHQLVQASSYPDLRKMSLSLRHILGACLITTLTIHNVLQCYSMFTLQIHANTYGVQFAIRLTDKNYIHKKARFYK